MCVELLVIWIYQLVSIEYTNQPTSHGLGGLLNQPIDPKLSCSKQRALALSKEQDSDNHFGFLELFRKKDLLCVLHIV